ncbi:MAG: UDP-N-acetylmuramoyl-L-alanyl-D-glutamate--2,6-diaminopimelate ligase [Bacteroidota bacterium]|nr:UDP-N-acetylmuramoyl-L-alanyl-D-glutamate--2,6-diaminopimelate ligase [Bacteroidota bacterium]
MKSLKDILYKVEIVSVIGTTDITVSSVCFDSREAAEKSLFVAIKGTQTDGNQYTPEVIKNGAIAIVSEQRPTAIIEGVSYIIVKNAAKALAVIAANFYHNPSKEIKIIGVTGTNGKTTIVSLLHDLFLSMGKKTGMLSTIQNKINKKLITSTHTTGDALQINQLLFQMIDSGCEYCFMEVSSHAIDQNRVEALAFDIMIFTNISHDHLDYHKTFNHYISTKKKVFDSLNTNAIALVNNDDKHGLSMIKNTKAKRCTYSLKSMSDYKCKVLENRIDGTLLSINNYDVWTKLIGEFNAYNLLAVYAVGNLLNIEEDKLLEGISLLNSVEGRFQTIRSTDGITAIVDYAHTPDALKNVLATINKIRSGNEKLITVVGCGGDRDTAKRSKMAAIAADLSTQVVITSDNPRSEDPEEIIKDMIGELDPVQKKKCLEITDRKQAIKTASTLAQENDIILIAGKGHEKYQEIKGVKYPFDDMQEIKQLFNLIKN